MVLSLLLAAVGIATVRHGFLTGKGITPGPLGLPVRSLTIAEEADQVRSAVNLPGLLVGLPWCPSTIANGWECETCSDCHWQSCPGTSSPIHLPKVSLEPECHTPRRLPNGGQTYRPSGPPSGFHHAGCDGLTFSSNPWMLLARPSSPHTVSRDAETWNAMMGLCVC